MTRKSDQTCVRCDGRSRLEKVADQYFCESCLAAARRHVYGPPEANAPVSPVSGPVKLERA